MKCCYKPDKCLVKKKKRFLLVLESSSRLTPFMLKSRTGEFDLESIHFLDLSGMGWYSNLIDI